MEYYMKVCPFIAEQLGLTEIRRKTADGNYLLWQQDVVAIQGETLEERSRFLGGVLIDAKRSKAELKGTQEPLPLIEPAEDDLPETEEEELQTEETKETKEEGEETKGDPVDGSADGSLEAEDDREENLPTKETEKTKEENNQTEERRNNV